MKGNTVMNRWITNKFMKILLIEDGSITNVKIGFYIETMLSEIEKIIIIIFVYGLLGFFKDIIVILSLMLMLRPYIGGTHKDTFKGCLLKTMFFSGIGILIARCIHTDIVLHIIATIILIYHIVKVGPVVSKYRPEYEGELLKRIKVKGVLMILILNVIYFCCNSILRNEVTVLMYMLILDVLMARGSSDYRIIIEGSSTEYTLNFENSVIELDEEFRGDEIDNQHYSVIINTLGNGGYVDGAGTYVKGSFLQLEAFLLPNSEFYGWYINDELVSMDSKYRFAVREDVVVTAKFASVDLHTFELNSTEGGYVENASSYFSKGMKIKVSAVPKEGYSFVGWISSDGGVFEDESALTTIYTMPNNATIVTACFRKNISEEESDKSEVDTDINNPVQEETTIDEVKEENVPNTGDSSNGVIWFSILLICTLIFWAGGNSLEESDDGMKA